jgi:hypothetical protein
MSFSVKSSNSQNQIMLNICDVSLLGKEISENELRLKLSKNYYYEKLVDEEEAISLLQNSSVINMVGEKSLSLSTSLGIGTKDGIKKIDGSPFMIVFKM